MWTNKLVKCDKNTLHFCTLKNNFELHLVNYIELHWISSLLKGCGRLHLSKHGFPIEKENAIGIIAVEIRIFRAKFKPCEASSSKAVNELKKKALLPQVQKLTAILFYFFNVPTRNKFNPRLIYWLNLELFFLID